MVARSHKTFRILLLSFALSAARCGDDSGGGSASGKGGAGGSSGGTVDAGAGGNEAHATQVCVHFCGTIEGLDCPNETVPCLQECRSYFNSPVCRYELRALIECSASRDFSDFECDSAGEADVKAGVCPDEKMAAVTCVDNR